MSWIDRSRHLSPCKFTHQFGTIAFVLSAPLQADLFGCSCHCRQRSFVLVAFAGQHQLPCDPGDLIGQRNGDKLGRVAFEHILHPRGSVFAFTKPDLEQQRCRSLHERAAQDFISRTRYPAKPELSACRMIPGRETNSGRKIAARTEQAWCRCLH